MNKEFFIRNRKNYLNLVADNSISIFFSGRSLQKTADQEYDFEVDKNFYYLSGIKQANVVLVLVKKGDHQKETLFIEKNDEVLSKWIGMKLTIEEANERSGIEQVNYLDGFDSFIFNALNSTRTSIARYKNVYLNLERRNIPGYTNQALEYAQTLKSNYPELIVHNAYELVIGLRMIKAPEELELIMQSIETTRYGIDQIMLNTKPGIYEYQVEAYFDFYLKYSDQKDTGFKTICASGKNATVLHYVDNNSILQDGDLLLLDLGARTEFYTSDITRTIPVSKKFSSRQREVYQEVLNVNKAAIEFLEEGVTLVEYNKYAKTLLTEAAKRLGLIKEDKDIDKYYYHSVGHFMGLDTHDPGLAEVPLKAGMVITCEPGLYIAEEGIGIRIEDDVLISDQGPINLSKNIIKEIEDIENFMATDR